MFKKIAPILMCLVLSVGCVTTQKPSVSLETLKLFDPKTSEKPIWTDWTVKKESKLGQPNLSTIHAFAYWRVYDETLKLGLSQLVYPILDMLRLQKGASTDARATVVALMTLLDPDEGSPQYLDMTFVVDRALKWEGVLCRLYGKHKNGALFGLSILYKRAPGEVEPGEVVMWGSSGFEEGAPFSASLKGTAQKGVSTLAKGLMLEPKGAQESSASVVLMKRILYKSVWPQVTGQAFIEPKIKVDKEHKPLLAAVPIAASLPIKARTLEEVLEGTVFLPDLDVDGLNFGKKTKAE